MRAERGLLIEERRRRICELVRAEGRVTVEDLAARFGTSQVTIRTDLATLEGAGALTRTHGGALSAQSDPPLDVKQRQHHAEKLRIAEAAAALIDTYEGGWGLAVLCRGGNHAAGSGVTSVTHDDMGCFIALGTPSATEVTPCAVADIVPTALALLKAAAETRLATKRTF